MNKVRWTGFLSGLICCLLNLSCPAAEPTREQVDFFEKKVRPILVERCYSCHSTAEKVKGGLLLESREDLLKGGDSGPAIIPGDPDHSRLIDAIRYQNRDLQMPPKNPLSAEQVKDFEQWVKQGAPDPRQKTAASAPKPKRVIDLAEGRKFWAFQPVQSPKVPVVKRAARVQSPVDAFIVAKLEEKGLKPAPPADRRTLIRRATFDLTGLPPTPEAVAAFVADRSPDAFAKVVDRLMSTPQYGERWGRHWLDVARYADSNGLDENVAFGNAWRYRDYVIRSFNQDKPFDRFLREQIAGDLLPAAGFATRNEQLTATGFLSIGAKVLAEPDAKKMEMDIIDEQIETTGRAFLGMTFGCARCHDHKFDPIATDDYYALAGIFKSTKTMQDFKIVAKWFESSLASEAEVAASKAHEKKLTDAKMAVTNVLTLARQTLLADAQGRAVDYLVSAARLSPAASTNEVTQAAEAAKLHAPILAQCRQYLSKATNAAVFKVWREAADRKATDEIERHYRGLFAEVQRALAENNPGTNALSDARLEGARKALFDPKGFLSLPAQPESMFPGGTVEKLKQLRDAVADLDKNTPELATAMGVAEGTNVVKTLPVHIRGSHLTLGKPVARGVPQVMCGSKPPSFSETQSGRLELANWLADPAHPTTARVAVNRIWRWHFGQGLVASTDNFGLLGERPSHPELLDWLAQQFVARGWSLKEMHRLMMLSSTYQMSSAPDTRAGTVDPENRLFWRANVQRLEAEEVRDALLATAGTLEMSMGGKTIPVKNREFVFNHTSKDEVTYGSLRRAVYLPIIRNHVYDLFEQFDYPDPAVPTGSRNATVVAPQALWLMNSELILQSAEKMAARVLARSEADDGSRLTELYMLAYGRPPTTVEQKRAQKFITGFTGSAADASNRTEAWTAFCQSLYASNEFIYLN